MQVDAGSVRATILNMRNFQVSERRVVRRVGAAMGVKLKAAIRRNISARDHSLQDLARLDHPYARRHGSIRIHGGGGNKELNDSRNLVHSQSGTMRGALRKLTENHARGVRVSVWVDQGQAPHAVYVIKGTRVMLARDVLWDTATAPAVRVAMMQEAVRILGAVLRTKAFVRFDAAGRLSGPAPGAEI